MIKNKNIFGLIIVLCLSLTGCKGVNFSSKKKVPDINTSINKESKNKNKGKQIIEDTEQTKKEVNAVFDNYLTALNNKDIKIMNYLDPKRKDYEIKHQLFKNTFNEFDIKYVSDKRILDIADDKTAILNTTIIITNDPRGASKKKIIDDIVLKKIDGEWKVHSEGFLN